MKCLISIRDDVDDPNILFSNGYSQNIKFFYDMLELMGHSPSFLTNKEFVENKLKFLGKNYIATSYEKLKNEKNDVDIIFEIGVSIDEDMRKLFRERGRTKIVSVRYGISLIMDMEQISHPQTLTPGIHRKGVDFVWTSPHIAYGLPYLETLYDTKGAICPYIWEPDFVEKKFTCFDKSITRDIYIMEPSISVIKNALVPIAIVEEVYREDPSAFGKATVVNGMKYNMEEYFLDNIVRNFKSLRSESNKVYFSPRARFSDVFSRADVLLGHQWGCELNYLYLEAIYSGLPLVHNSDSLQEVGYYYPGFDCHRGKEKCLEALRTHDEQEAITKGHEFLQQYSIRNLSVQKEYNRLIEMVLNS